MVKVSTFKITPFLALQSDSSRLSSEWLREAINTLVRQKWQTLEQAGADPSLFFNRDVKTGKTRVGYPLVIYHYFNGSFYITGVNKGAFALEIFASLYKEPFCYGNIIMEGFSAKNLEKNETDISVSPEKKLYMLTKWIPFHYKMNSVFENTPLTKKAGLLNNQLYKHLENELGKYLGLNFQALKAEITDILKAYQKPFTYKGHPYFCFDIVFSSNASLPPMLTLGNIKALGYGRIEKI